LFIIADFSVKPSIMSLADLTFLRTFTSGDPAKMTKYINMFLGMAPQSLTQMRQQLEASDLKALRTSAHSLKTQLKYMGITQAVDLAYTIEQRSGDGTQPETLPALVSELETLTNQAITELKEAVSKL
jgi:HPt (histidine-containing phosphotransfer) domain-containing protein